MISNSLNACSRFISNDIIKNGDKSSKPASYEKRWIRGVLNKANFNYFFDFSESIFEHDMLQENR